MTCNGTDLLSVKRNIVAFSSAFTLKNVVNSYFIDSKVSNNYLEIRVLINYFEK